MLIWARSTILAILVIVAGVSGSAFCQRSGAILLLQQTPADGGTLSPGVGIHNFEVSTSVTLTAVPKPGYQFVYWLGDVSDPKANSTTAYLDTPKIIIAVFERSEYDLLAFEQRPRSGAAGGLRPRPVDYSRQGGSGIGGQRQSRPRWPSQPKEKEEPADIPVPEEEPSDFPVPEIPEPGTMWVLGTGGLILLRRRRTNYVLREK